MDIERYLGRCIPSGDHLIWPGATNGGVPVIHSRTEGTHSLRRVLYAHYADIPIQDIPSHLKIKPSCGHRDCVSESCLQAVNVSTGKVEEVRKPRMITSVFDLA